MKKYNLLLIGFVITGCTASKYTLEEASGFSTSNITSIVYSQSLWQSSTWAWPLSDYSALDVFYIKTDIDVAHRFFTTEGAQNVEAIYLHIKTDTQDQSPNNTYLFTKFIFDKADRYIYLKNADDNYRSLNKVSASFIDAFDIER